jgi:hypothetical protein
MPSAMRRTIILLVLALSGGLLASCGKGGQTAASTSEHAATATSSSPTPSAAITSQQALAFANAVNLTAADVPGFTVSSRHGGSDSTGEKRLEREMSQCAGLAGSAKGIAEASSKSFQLKHSILDFGVSSEVAVEPSAAQASRGLAAIRSAHVRGCFSRYLGAVLKGERFGGPTVGPVTIQSGTPPAPGASGSFGWRVTATFFVRGIRVPLYLDFLGFVDGPAEVTLLSSGLLRPFPAAVQQHLFSLLLSRAEAHRP